MSTPPIISGVPSRDSFINEFKDILYWVAEIGDAENHEWTQEIFKKLDEFAAGYKEHLDSYHTGAGNKEWLYDCTLWQKSPQRIYACIEIEWGDDIEMDVPHWDYSKVLTARTDIPIFVTQVKDKGNKKDAEDKLDELIEEAATFDGNPNPFIAIAYKEGDSWEWKFSS